KFECNFLKDNAQVKTCTIDSDNAGNNCQFDYSASVRGSCFALSFLGTTVIVACAFHDPAIKPWEFTSVTGNGSKPSMTVAASAGLLALGGGVVQPSGGFIGATYLEKTGASKHQATCSTP